MHMSLHNSFSGAIATLGGWEAMMADIAIFAEAVALVSAAPAALSAAPSVETHPF